MAQSSFKERVKNAAIEGAKIYQEKFVECEYLLCSKAFQKKGYYIAKADEGNYQHLIGVHTELTPKEFFVRCYVGSLVEDDFDFYKKNQNEKVVKGSVRQKIKVLPEMLTMFEKELVAEEDFKMNRVECAFATSDNILTLGYAAAGRPKSLLQGNELDVVKMKKVDMLLKKKRGAAYFDEIIYCNAENVNDYVEQIKSLIDEKTLYNLENQRYDNN